MSRDLDDRVHALAGTQLGLITRRDVLSRGGSDTYIQTCLERRRWQPVQAGVYLTGSAPPTWLQKQLAACMAVGPPAVASHRAAAALWWLDGAEESVVEITAPEFRLPEPHGVIVHRTRRWYPDQQTVRRRVPVTDVNRTLVDYAAVCPPLLVERAVEDAFRRKLTNEGALRRRLAVIGGPGARGAGRLRRVLDLRPEGKPARSGFEVMVLDVFRQFGLPIPVRNYVVWVNGIAVAELDLALPWAMVDVEADGGKWHSTRRQRQRDAERQAVLEALGWNVLRFGWEQVVYRPETVDAEVRSALRGFLAA